MRSHLTRLVFRHMLANQPIIHRDCLHRASRIRPVRQHVAPTYPFQRRSIFGFSRKPERRMKSADIAPGFEKMAELGKMLYLGARPPPPSEVAAAFRDFMRYKRKRKEPLEDIQTACVLKAFNYLKTARQGNEVGKEGEPHLSFGDLLLARDAVTSLPLPIPKDRLGAHKNLARALYAEIVARRKLIPLPAQHLDDDVWPLAIVLCNAGESLEAWQTVEGLQKDVTQSSPAKAFSGRNGESTVLTHRTMNTLLGGFAREGNEEEFLRIIRLMEARSDLTSSGYYVVAVHFYAHRDDFENTKLWYDRIKNVRGLTRMSDVYEVVVDFCLRNNHIEWGQSIIRTMIERKPKKSSMDIILEWAAGTGKGVEEIDRMINVMERETSGDIRADVVTINRLVKFAISRKNSYLAERYIALGEKRGIRPNATTYLMQMDYRLSVGDLDGARAAHGKLQAEEILNNEDIPLTNRLIRAMVSSKRYDIDVIMAIVEDLNARKTRFEPATVSALSLLHIQRDELIDVIDLLQTHAYHYSSEARGLVREVFINYCLDHNNSVSKAWDTYTIISQFFDESDREDRTKIMESFFARRRADMAVHIFNGMRQHARADTRPTVDTYISCLSGIAQTADEEALEQVHNQLRVDFRIEPSTRLNNALMLAYNACGDPSQSLSFWESIVRSREGPTYESIHIAFRACERAPFGERTARKIWSRLRRMEVEIDSSMWASYLASLVGSGDYETMAECMQTVERLKAEAGFKPDSFILGSMFNATSGKGKQDEFEKWVREKYPDEWKELEKIGMVTGRYGARTFKIDRSVSP
ncbi:hypothetical protein BJ546DRAFT_869745 [Cryomyces antarcticus]